MRLASGSIISHALVIAIGLVASSLLHAATVSRASLDTALTYSYATRQGQSVQAQLELTPAAEMTLSSTATLVASARVRLDQRDALEPGAYDFASYTRWSRPINLGTTGTVELRDLFIEWRAANGVTRIGKQQIVWGRLDGLKVLDVINPQDFREFIDDDFDASRISLWSAYFDYSFGRWRTELAVVPDSTAHVIPEPGAWFELSAPRFRFGSDRTANPLPSVTRAPQLSGRETALGVRFSRPMGNADISAVAYSGIDPEPLGRLITRSDNTFVERFYERRETLGISFDIGLGSVVLRGEYAFQPDRRFNTRPNGAFAIIARNQHRAALGMDIEAPFGVFINAQYFVDIVSDAPAPLVRPATDRIATLFARRTFAYDALALELRGYHSFSDNDRRASIGIAYAINDATSLKLSARYASGTPDGLFGQFADRDILSIGVQHTF